MPKSRNRARNYPIVYHDSAVNRAPTRDPQPPRLLDQVRSLAQVTFGRPEPGERHAESVRRYVLYHGKRHPRDMGHAEINGFLRQS